MTRRIGMLSVAQTLVAALVLTVGAQAGLAGAPGPAAVVAAVAFAGAGLVTMHIELRRHACAVTMVEAALVATLFHLQPVDVVLGAVAGEALVCLIRRQPGLQLAFNASGAALTVSIAVAVFTAFPGAGPADPAGWVAAFVTAACFGLASHTSTSLVLSIVEGRRFAPVFAEALAPSAAATVVSASLGTLLVMQASASGAGVLLLAPLVGMMVLETRRLAAHRADHLRFKRLYAASARTGRLVSQLEAMSTLADEARSLVTGASAVCCTTDRNGRWHGVVVGDDGHRTATASEVAAALGLRAAAAGELGADDVPAALTGLASPVESLVFASSSEGATTPVVLLVARRLPGGYDKTRAEVLTAFVGHAVLTIANAALYADIEDALAYQVDLNRQKDDFVAAVSHELRTPLTSMIGSVSSIRRLSDKLTPEKQATLVDVALRQGARLKQLIEDLLLLSSIEGVPKVSGDVVDVDLRAIAEEIAGDLRGPRVDGAAVGITFAAGTLPPIRCDEGKLRQIITNLVENARKYAPHSDIEIEAAAAGGRVVLDVVDHGEGISTADRHRVFERFVQLDQSSTRSRGGTGLGLYLCRQLAIALGGTLALSETDGGGCRFTLTFPAVRTIIDLSPGDDSTPTGGELVGASTHGSET